MINIAVISDNDFLLKYFLRLIKPEKGIKADVYYTDNINVNDKIEKLKGSPILLKNNIDFFIEKYSIVFSIHCKQIFPAFLVQNIRCYNLHPGYNPYNRGFFPQVFSILNNLPAGATLHRIDNLIDHGYIVDNEIIKIDSWDTSLSLYNKILQTEMQILKRSLLNTIHQTYTPIYPQEGNYNSYNDFKNLLELNLDKVTTLGEAIKTLRALSHFPYNNAFFTDPITGKKVFVRVELSPEKE